MNYPDNMDLKPITITRDVEQAMRSADGVMNNYYSIKGSFLNHLMATLNELESYGFYKDTATNKIDIVCLVIDFLEDYLHVPDRDQLIAKETTEEIKE